MFAKFQSHVSSLTPAGRFLAGTAIALVIWLFPATGLTVALIALISLLALVRSPDRWQAWRNPVGLAFGLLIAYLLVTLPFSPYPKLAADALGKTAHLYLAALALPLIFRTRAQIEGALYCSAAAITLAAAADLARLIVLTGPELIIKARDTQPYIMNHPNVASMMAAACLFVLALAAWRHRHSRAALLAALAGIAIDLAYLVALASRGPQLAFLATALLAGAVILPTWRGKLAWLAVMAAAVALLASQAYRINPRFRYKDVGSLNQRTIVWKHTWKLVQQHPQGADMEWLAGVQACLLNIELRMRELLGLLR